MCPKPVGYPEQVLDEWEELYSLVEQFEIEVQKNQQLKKKNCSMALFNRELKEARKIARSIGIRINLVKVPLVWGKDKSRHPSGNFGWKSGSITVKSVDKNGKFSVLNVLYHELRHALHFHIGLYPDYYSNYIEENYQFLHSGDVAPKTMPSPYLSWAAEVDCDLSAIREMNKKSYRPHYLWYQLYSPGSVMTIRLFMDILAQKHLTRIRSGIPIIMNSDSWAAFINTSKVFKGHLR